MSRHRSVSVIVKNTAMRHSPSFPQCDSTARPVGGMQPQSSRCCSAFTASTRPSSLKLEVWWRNAAGDTETQGPTVAAAAVCWCVCVCPCAIGYVFFLHPCLLSTGALGNRDSSAKVRAAAHSQIPLLHMVVGVWTDVPCLKECCCVCVFVCIQGRWSAHCYTDLLALSLTECWCWQAGVKPKAGACQQQ